MDANTFDELVARIFRGASRRDTVRGVVAGAVAAAGVPLLTEAKHGKGKGKHRKGKAHDAGKGEKSKRQVGAEAKQNLCQCQGTSQAQCTPTNCVDCTFQEQLGRKARKRIKKQFPFSFVVQDASECPGPTTTSTTPTPTTTTTSTTTSTTPRPPVTTTTTVAPTTTTTTTPAPNTCPGGSCTLGSCLTGCACVGDVCVACVGDGGDCSTGVACCNLPTSTCVAGVCTAPTTTTTTTTPAPNICTGTDFCVTEFGSCGNNARCKCGTDVSGEGVCIIDVGSCRLCTSDADCGSWRAGYVCVTTACCGAQTACVAACPVETETSATRGSGKRHRRRKGRKLTA